MLARFSFISSGTRDASRRYSRVDTARRWEPSPPYTKSYCLGEKLNRKAGIKDRKKSSLSESSAAPFTLPHFRRKFIRKIFIIITSCSVFRRIESKLNVVLYKCTDWLVRNKAHYSYDYHYHYCVITNIIRRTILQYCLPVYTACTYSEYELHFVLRMFYEYCLIPYVLEHFPVDYSKQIETLSTFGSVRLETMRNFSKTQFVTCLTTGSVLRLNHKD